VRRREGEPGPLAWLVGFASLLLPWAGGMLMLAGAWLLVRQDAGGWWYLGAGGVLFGAELLLDHTWTRPARLPSDQPDLNRRPEQLVGRVLRVEQAIAGGRGKVRAGDTLWPAEGPDLPAGAAARVAAVRGSVLVVERTPT
jgi:membrane protein implicated in regulation of membrane protease activity